MQINFEMEYEKFLTNLLKFPDNLQEKIIKYTKKNITRATELIKFLAIKISKVIFFFLNK